MCILYGVLLGLLQIWEQELIEDEGTEQANHPAEHHAVVGSTYQSQYTMDGYPPAVNSAARPQGQPSATPAAVTNTDFAPAVDKRM